MEELLKQIEEEMGDDIYRLHREGLTEADIVAYILVNPSPRLASLLEAHFRETMTELTIEIVNNHNL